MWKRLVGIVSILALSSVTGAWAQKLGVGDAPPPITVKGFVKGAPVSTLEKGKLYVVEFWATWCGPCRVSIPHLTELHKQYPDVTLIGVSVWEQDQSRVKPFVQEMGEKMAYTVAMDEVPDGARGLEGKMAKAWMAAADQHGIPTAFLINRDGKIAWIGHPMSLDAPLGKVVAGTWDLSAATAEFQQRQAQQSKMRELQAKLTRARQAGDTNQWLALLDQAIAEDPALESSLGIQKFSVLATQMRDTEKAAAYGHRLVETVFKNNANGLNALAWTVVAPGAPKADASVVKLALQAAQRADELVQGKDASIADTLAKAYFDSGNAAKALETQERAIQLAKGTPKEQDAGLQARLELYQSAVHKQ